MVERPADIVEIREDERLLRVEPKRNDIPRVLLRKSLALLELEVELEQELLVVCERTVSQCGVRRTQIIESREEGDRPGGLTGELDDERAVKDVLEPLGEDEGDGVPQVHAVARRAPAGVQVERLLLLVPVKNQVKLAVCGQGSQHSLSE